MLRLTACVLMSALALAVRSRAQETAAEAAPEAAADAAQPKLNSATLSGLAFRSIGPALMSGRISDLAIDPRDPNTWYAAAGSGGVWKTVNAGTTWRPIFDGYGVYSIGCVALDPRDPNVVWVGTGENVGGRHVGVGDGVYRSRDGGGSFEHLGLKQSEHIGKILIDPRDAHVVYVAVQGPLWTSGGERGLYKTSDGGKSWNLVLSAGPYTGVTDVIADPRDPDVLYAATWQRQRTVAALIDGGPESGIHKSADAGATWTKLGGGLPGEDLGKIGLALSPQQPDVLYATIELAGRSGGFWRSADGGASWNKRSDYVSGGTGPHYYQELWPDPHRFDVVYQANVVLGRTLDGGATWEGVGNQNKHVDNHALAFVAGDPKFLLVGCDGGVYVSRDRGETFAFVANLPLTQFYKVDVDNDWPVYHVVGGTQDNATQYGPARTLNDNGIRNADWRVLIGGDGHDCAIDPEDPNVIYCESQEGYLRRFDRRSGQAVDVRPQPGAGEGNERFNWDSPILISPHAHTRLYFASQRVFRSDDRGESWTAISGDLTRGQDRLQLPLMERVWSIDALWDLSAMSIYGSISAIAESPLVEGLLYVGTDDGLVQVSEDGGASWRRVDRLGETPEFAFVNDLKADRFHSDTVYAALDHHKAGDYRPYLVKSTDRGRTWASIAGDLPERHLVWRVEQDHVKPELLFAGTEYGIFTSLDGGARWFELSGGLPTIPFRDLAIQRRESDLIGASFGRGFYVLDDYAPLREVSEELLAGQEFVLFPVRKAWSYLPEDRLGGRHGSQGDGHYAADNPPFGAVFRYYLRDAWKTAKAVRQEEEAKRKKEGADTPYPGWEALKHEAREQEPALWFEIRAADGSLVDRLTGATGAGIQSVVWNLRYDDPTREDDAGGGPLALPGRYTVQALRRAGDGAATPLGAPRSFEVEAVGAAAVPPQERATVLAFQEEVSALLRSLEGANGALRAASEQLERLTTAIGDSRAADLALLDEARRLQLALLDAREALFGDPLRQRHGHEGVPSLADRLRNAWSESLQNTHGPTLTHHQQVAIARQEYAAALETVRRLVEVELEALKGQLDAAGVPWTPGRAIPPLPE